MEYGSRSILLLLVCSFAANVYGIRFTILPEIEKCIKDNAQQHQLNVMTFSMTEVAHHEFEYIVSA